MTEFRLYRTMGCYDTALQTNGAQIDINPDGTIEISTWTGQQASHTPANEVGRRLYEFGLDLKNPIYVEPKASIRYMAVVEVVKDLKARGYRHVRLVDLPA